MVLVLMEWRQTTAYGTFLRKSQACGQLPTRICHINRYLRVSLDQARLIRLFLLLRLFRLRHIFVA